MEAEALAPETEPSGRCRPSPPGGQSTGRAKEGSGREAGNLDMGKPREVCCRSPRRMRGFTCDLQA